MDSSFLPGWSGTKLNVSDSPTKGNVAASWQWRELGLNPKGSACNSRILQEAAEDHLVNKAHLNERGCELPGIPKSTFLMVFSPDGTKVASTHGNHMIYVSELSSGKHVKTLSGHPRTPWCVAFHPSHPRLLGSGCLGGQVRVWDLSGGSEVWTVSNKTVIASIAFHPRDRLLVIATYNDLYFWDWAHPQPFTKVQTNTIKEKVRFVSFDALGHKLITGISVWSFPNAPGSLLQPLGHSSEGASLQNPSSNSSHDQIPSYTQLLQRYDSLVRNYRHLFLARSQLNTIDRGTDPMEVELGGSGPSTSARTVGTERQPVEPAVQSDVTDTSQGGTTTNTSHPDSDSDDTSHSATGSLNLDVQSISLGNTPVTRQSSVSRNDALGTGSITVTTSVPRVSYMGMPQERLFGSGARQSAFRPLSELHSSSRLITSTSQSHSEPGNGNNPHSNADRLPNPFSTPMDSAPLQNNDTTNIRNELTASLSRLQGFMENSIDETLNIIERHDSARTWPMISMRDLPLFRNSTISSVRRLNTSPPINTIVRNPQVNSQGSREAVNTTLASALRLAGYSRLSTTEENPPQSSNSRIHQNVSSHSSQENQQTPSQLAGAATTSDREERLDPSVALFDQQFDTLDAPSTSRQSQQTSNQGRTSSSLATEQNQREDTAFGRVTRGVQAIERHTEALVQLCSTNVTRSPLRQLRRMWEDLRREIITIQRPSTSDQGTPSYFSLSAHARCNLFNYMSSSLVDRNRNPRFTNKYSSSSSNSRQQNTAPQPQVGTSRSNPSNTETVQSSESPVLNISDSNHSEATSSSLNNSESNPNIDLPSTSSGRRNEPRTRYHRTYPPSSRLQAKLRSVAKRRSLMLNSLTSYHVSRRVIRNRSPYRQELEITRDNIRYHAHRVLAIMFSIMMHCLEAEQLGNQIIIMLRSLKKALGLTCLLLMSQPFPNESHRNEVANSQNNSNLPQSDSSSTNQNENSEISLPQTQSSSNENPSTSAHSSNTLRDRIAIQISAANRNNSTSAKKRKETYYLFKKAQASRVRNPFMRFHFVKKESSSERVKSTTVQTPSSLNNSKPTETRIQDDPVPSTSGVQRNLSFSNINRTNSSQNVSSVSDSQSIPSFHNTSMNFQTSPSNIQNNTLTHENDISNMNLNDTSNSNSTPNANDSPSSANNSSNQQPNNRRMYSRMLFRRFLYDYGFIRDVVGVFRRPESQRIQPLSERLTFRPTYRPRIFSLRGASPLVSENGSRSETMESVVNNVVVPIVRVNDVPVSEAQLIDPAPSSNLHNMRPTESPILPQNVISIDDNGGPGLLDAGPSLVMETPESPVHRIQVWDFTQGQLPDISNANMNVVVQKCKIHNDASIDISRDGRLLVALLPAQRMRNITHRLGIYSLDWNCLGECLYTALLEQNAVSISLSPCARHLAVGLGSRRMNLQSYGRNGIMALIFRLGGLKKNDNNTRRGCLIPIRSLEQSWELGFTSLNCLRWAPQPGQGLVYANNTGQLKILS